MKLTINTIDEVDYIKLTSEVLKTCESKSIPLNSIESGVASDIPVLLATLIVELYISHLIKLPEQAYDINNIENKVLVTSCKFLQGPNVLFINGFIRKKIYYTSKPHNDSRYHNLDIPFECTTTVILNNSIASSILDNTNTKYSSQSKLLSVDVSNYHQKSIEFLNKKPFCELISSKITEQYKYIYKNDKAHGENPLDIKEIIKIDNNMSIMLEIQILQNQQVNIKPHCDNKQDTSSDSFKPSSDNNADIKNEHHDDNNLDSINNTDLGNKSNLFDKANVKNKPTLDSLYSESDDNKLNSINKPNLEDEPSPLDKPDILNKPDIDDSYNKSNTKDKLNLDHVLNLYNEPNADKVDSVSKPDNNEIEPNIDNRDDTETKSPFDTLNNEFSYNDKLDLDYLLNFYSKPDDDFDLIDRSELENESMPYDKVNVDNKQNFNNLFSLFNSPNYGSKHDLNEKHNHENSYNQYNKAPANNKLDFISLLGLFNKPTSNHDFKYRSNLDNKSHINNKSDFNNYHMNSRNSSRTYNYQSNSYKLLILILCIFILYNLYNRSLYS